MTEPHEVLGVPEDATPDGAKRVRRALAQIFHPNRFADASDAVKVEAGRRMQELAWAYQEIRHSGDLWFWEAPDWTNEMRGELTTSLLDAGIPHRWDAGTLTVLLRYEEQVDELLDELFIG